MKRGFSRPRPRTLAAIAGAVLAVGAGAWVSLSGRGALSAATGEVTRGEFVEVLHLRGEVKPVRAIAMVAPTQSGDLRIVKLARNGTVVKAGDVVVQFDTTTLQRRLEEKQSELKRADAEIERTRAQSRIQEEQSLTEVTAARYNLDRARLDAGALEFLSRVDAEQRKLAQGDAEQRLHESEERLKSVRVAATADAQSAVQKRDKALGEVREAERAIDAMALKSPAAGAITLMPNYRAGGMFSGASGAPEFREGDRAWPGASIAEIPDLSTVLVIGRLDEAERGRVEASMPAVVRIEAIPGEDLAGHVAEISTLTRSDFGTWPPDRSFDVTVQLDRTHPKIRTGMTCAIDVEIRRVPNTVLAPAAGVFQKGGRTVVYVAKGRGFEQREIDVAGRSDGQVAVSHGVEPGDRITLKDPTVAEPEKRR